jgi:hypothetical protein
MNTQPESDQGLEKVWFRIEQDKDGYPPVQVESVWAAPSGRDIYRLENVPFFAKGVSFKDEVFISQGSDGHKWYADVVVPSGHSTVRVIVYRNASLRPLEERVSELRQRFVERGCITELSHLPGLFAVDVPPSISIETVRPLLEEGAASETWDYEESNLCHAS